ncbi:unnamed protein product [Eruca vesicaria subsp. sativa]|uniref:Uncharacterized protein n=1 Tax=Eruca vesicaria subsp. sativa TaxID=29727 RepID=A0ABC8JSD0_ERUVS|nr:unnamed protein product [Eruca vesicaria subsp. sativa]
MSGRLRVDVEYSTVHEKQEERSFYYGGASVPFLWESRPGTPKHNHFSEFSLPPPLTPPPSYYSSSGILSTPKRQNKVRTKLTRILSMSLFHDLRKSNNSRNKKPNYVTGSSYYSWSSMASSSSFSSSPPHSLRKPVRRGKKSPLLFDSYK